MQNNYKNPDFQTKLLQSLTKYGSKSFGFDKMLNEDVSIKKRGTQIFNFELYFYLKFF